MINLLPRENLRQLKAAQQNTLIVRYTILSLISLVAIVVIFGITFIFLKAAEHQGNITAKQHEDKLSSYASVRQEAKSYEDNLKAAKHLLNQNIPYTNALLNIASAIPQNTVLQSITLSPASVKAPFTLNARTVSYDGAIKLRDSLSEKRIGTDVKLLSVTDDRGEDRQNGEGSDPLVAKYPFSVSIQINFSPSLLEKQPIHKRKSHET